MHGVVTVGQRAGTVRRLPPRHKQASRVTNSCSTSPMPGCRPPRSRNSVSMPAPRCCIRGSMARRLRAVCASWIRWSSSKPRSTYESPRLRRSRGEIVDRGPRSHDPESQRCDRQGGHHHHLRDRSAHPQRRRPRGGQGPHPGPRRGRHHHGDRLLRHQPQGRGPRHHFVHQVLRALRQLQDRPVLPLPGRRGSLRHRLGLRPSDRRHPGRVRARPLRRELPAPPAGGGQRPAGRHALRHPPHRLRDRRAVRPGQARRHGRRHRRRPGGTGRDLHRRALRRRDDHRRRPRREPAREVPRIRRHRRRPLRRCRLEGAGAWP